MSQNQIQNPEAIFCGQGRLWVGENFEALTEVGLIRNLRINHKIKIKQIGVDGAPNLKYYQDGRKYSLEFELGEITPRLWQIFNRNLLSVEAQNITPQNLGLLGESVARFQYTNGAGETFTLDLEKVTNLKTLGLTLANASQDIAFQEIELEGQVIHINDQINF